MDCCGTYFTHVQTCDVTRVQSAMEWTASVQTTHVQTCDVTRVQSATQYDCFGAYFTHCFGVRLSVFGFRFSAFGFWPSACGFRFSSFGFRLPASCFVCTTSAFGFRLSAFGFRRLDPQPRTSLRLMSPPTRVVIRIFCPAATQHHLVYLSVSPKTIKTTLENSPENCLRFSPCFHVGILNLPGQVEVP